MNNAMLDDIREKVSRMFNEAFPGADRNAAWTWRIKNVGKGETSEWDHHDWVKAYEALRVKLGIPVRVRSSEASVSLELPL